MSIISDRVTNGKYVADSASVLKPNYDKRTKKVVDPTSTLVLTPLQQQCREEFLNDFRLSWQTMHLPRAEFNDMSLYQRYVIDMLAFNTYQENDGNPFLEDRISGWQSTAMRPIIRNAAVSIAAHQTARQLVPKIFAYNQESDEQEDAAKVMSYLVDWAREQANYPYKALFRNIAGLYSPISWGYTEYVEVYKNIKDGKSKDGNWNYKEILDEEESGFQHIPLSTDQVFFSSFYEREVQKQDFIILRRIISYDKAKMKYPESDYPNMKHVRGGVQVTMDDANNGWYNVYDPHMRAEDVEELIRWRKDSDSKEIMVNGVPITEPYAENPRADHQYPFDAFYYLPINERCIAGKSLVFALQNDARLANEFYQMISDGTKLNLFPPTVTTGSEKTGTDVMIPGLNLAFSDKDVQVNALRTADGQSLATAMNTLEKIESSIHESSQDPIQQGQNPNNGPASTAFEISRIEQNSATVLGLSIKFFTFQHVIPFGKLLLSDILQYMTMPDAEKITDEGGLLYKTFYAKEPGKNGKQNKISFDANLPDSMTEDEKLEMSWKILEAQGGIKSNTTLWKVNPSLFRNHKYTFTVDADVLNPRSAELERAYDLETYDRAIASPVANQENLFKDLLMSSNPKTERDPERYITPPQPPQPGQGAPQTPANGQQGTPSASKPSNVTAARQSLAVKQ